jgi:putative endopeptidase
MVMSRFALILLLAMAILDSALAADKPAFGSWGFDLQNLDRSVGPGDDFYLYANGGWLKTAEISADRSSTGSFDDLAILSEKRLGEIVQTLETRDRVVLDANERKLRDLYNCFLDTKAIGAKAHIRRRWARVMAVT